MKIGRPYNSRDRLLSISEQRALSTSFIKKENRVSLLRGVTYFQIQTLSISPCLMLLVIGILIYTLWLMFNPTFTVEEISHL